MLEAGCPYIEVKKARIARAGKQFYLASEIDDRKIPPAKKKTIYVEYKPPEVVIKNVDKFNNIPFVNDHAPVDLSPENWKQYAIGFVSGNAAVEVTDSGEVFVTNNVVFYDKAAYDLYKAGKVELSASSRLLRAAVKNADSVGFDYYVSDILSVNHVALVDRARAGREARVLDSMCGGKSPFGEVKMFEKLRELLGIKARSDDAAFKLSEAVFAGVAKVGKVDDAALDAEIVAVMEHVRPLGDGAAKDLLVAAVADSFKNAEEVLANKEKVAVVIDGLYDKCRTEDAEKAQAVLDALGKPADKKDGEEGKKDGEGDAKDAAPDMRKLVDDAIARAMTGMKEDLPGIVDASVKKALGLQTEAPKHLAPAAFADSEPELDVSDMFRDAWGRM
jgi:hypothetical protein